MSGKSGRSVKREQRVNEEHNSMTKGSRKVGSVQRVKEDYSKEDFNGVVLS